MFRILSPRNSGISGRHSELIELSLSYGMDGFELDFGDFQAQVDTKGMDQAARFLKGAPVKIGVFELPIQWEEDDDFSKAKQRLPRFVESAQTVGASRCYVTLPTGSDRRPYHENFELHSQRLSELAELLQQDGIQLGVDFTSPLDCDAADGYRHPFVTAPDALAALVTLANGPHLGIVVDLWKWYAAGFGMDVLGGLSAERIVFVRVADAPEDVPVEQLTGQQRLLPSENGPVQVAQSLTRLGELGYEGPIACTPAASQLEGKSREEVVKLTAEALESQWKAAGLNRGGRLTPAESSAESE